ncbi:PilN domain-containing protein, partial [Methylopila henanensis]
RAADLVARAAAGRAALLRLSGGGSREASLIAEKRPETAAVTFVDRLASALPDGAALRELELDGARVRLAGDAEAAPELIGLLEATGALRGAHFAAPVQRRPDGRDGFEIAAERTPAVPRAAGRTP